MNAPLDVAIQDLLQGSGTQFDPNRSVNDVLGSLGLPSLPTLPAMPALPDMPPLPVLDLSALTKPITDLAASFGTGRTDTGLGPDASAVLSQVAQVLQTGVSVGSSALEAVMALWQGMGAESAQTTATQAAGDGAALANQGTRISTGTAAAATSVFTGRALTAAITAKYLASLAAAGPFLGTAPGQAFVVAATAETLAEVLAVIAKTRAELTFHGANVAQAGTKVPVRPAPKGLGANASPTQAAPASATSAAPSAGSSAASSAGSSADSMSQSMEMLQEVATVGMGLSQAATAAQSAGSLETIAAQQFSHPNAVGAAGGGVLAGGAWGPGAGGAADAAALTSARTPAALAGSVTSAAASAAEAEAAAPAGSPGMMPMSGAGAARAASSTTSSEALRGQLVTAQHGNEVVGPLDAASVPVVGAADTVLHPVTAHAVPAGPPPDVQAAPADPPDKALTL